MNLRLNKMQKTVLNMLLDTYENSATYRGTAAKNQSFSIKPEKVYPDYNGDYTDSDEVNRFNQDMQQLAGMDYIILEYAGKSSVICKIKLRVEALADIYLSLGREDITGKRSRESELYLKYKGKHYIIDAFCDEQVDRLTHHKNAKFTSDIAVNILELLKYILNNTQDIMERELSIAVLGDTKLFENSYKSRVCKIIEEYGNHEMDLSVSDMNGASEKEKAILEEYHIFSNPSYIFFKGNVEIFYADGVSIKVTPDKPIAILSETIAGINTIKIYSDRVITVENLTAYNRIKDSASTFIYLSGYHNTAKQNFLKKIAEHNKSVLWYHFGDIDPDGYFILKNLVDKTGIPFTPLYMDTGQLRIYQKYCRHLEKNDIVKARTLIELGFYKEVMEFMLENDCKLEQEIIGWELGRQS